MSYSIWESDSPHETHPSGHPGEMLLGTANAVAQAPALTTPVFPHAVLSQKLSLRALLVADRQRYGLHGRLHEGD